MIALASGSGMGVGRVSGPLRGVGVLAMADSVPDSTPSVDSVCQLPLGAGVLRLLVHGVAVGVIIDCCGAAKGVISAMRAFFSEDEGVEY